MSECGFLRKIHDVDKLIMKEFIAGRENSSKFYVPSATQMKIMKYILDNCDNPVYQRDLENILGLSRASVSGVLKTMEKHKMIKRVIDSDDVRCKRIMLNDAALMIFNQGKEKFTELEAAVIKGLSKKELDTFDWLIKKIENNIIDYVNEKG